MMDCLDHNTRKQVFPLDCQQGILSKIYNDYLYYTRILESLHRIHPSSRYKTELAIVSSTLQRLSAKTSL